MKKKFLSLGTAFLIAVGVGLNPMVVSANTNNEVNVTDASEEPFICQSDDIIRVIENNEETYYFADLLGRQILVVSGKPQNDDEIIELMEKADANIHYAYIEYNETIVYKKGSDLITTGYKRDVKYIINLDTMEIIDNCNDTVLQNLKKNNQYFTVTRDADGKIRMSTLIYEGHQLSMGLPFISPAAESMTLADVNFDDKIDVSDISLMSLYLIGDKTFDNKQLMIADVDGDGTVSLADLARLRQYLSKKIDTLYEKEETEYGFTPISVRVTADNSIDEYPQHQMITDRAGFDALFTEKQELEIEESGGKLAKLNGKYTDEWFETHKLYVAYPGVGGPTSTRYKVEKVTNKEVTIYRDLLGQSQSRTEEYADWIIFIEVSRDADVTEDTEITFNTVY